MVESKLTTLMVKVFSPYKIYYNGQATSISAVNLTGPFDILPGHHNFICLLKSCELSIRENEEVIRIKINGGLMHVRKDMAVVFLDI